MHPLPPLNDELEITFIILMNPEGRTRIVTEKYRRVRFLCRNFFQQTMKEVSHAHPKLSVMSEEGTIKDEGKSLPFHFLSHPLGVTYYGGVIRFGKVFFNIYSTRKRLFVEKLQRQVDFARPFSVAGSYETTEHFVRCRERCRKGLLKKEGSFLPMLLNEVGPKRA